MDKKTEKIEKYKISIDLLKYEGEMLWRILSSYMIVNTIIIGFVSQIAFDDKIPQIRKYNSICFIAGIIGIILIFPWFGTFIRNSYYYHFRMEQAKTAEPKKWNLLRKSGEKFAEGNQVRIKKDLHQIGYLGRFMRNKRAIYILVGIFGFIYLSFIVLFGPWWCK